MGESTHSAIDLIMKEWKFNEEKYSLSNFRDSLDDTFLEAYNNPNKRKGL